MAHKGHTGIEGQSVKVIGVVAALAGLVWVALAYLIQDAASALVLPIILSVSGIVTFLIGRSVAKAHAGSRE